MDIPIKQDRAKATLANVRAAAERVVLREGILSFTTAQVAEEAGVSIGTVYRYFRNRVDILNALAPGFEDKMTDDFQFLLEENKRGGLSLRDGVVMVDPDPGANPTHASLQRAS